MAFSMFQSLITLGTAVASRDMAQNEQHIRNPFFKPYLSSFLSIFDVPREISCSVALAGRMEWLRKFFALAIGFLAGYQEGMGMDGWMDGSMDGWEGLLTYWLGAGLKFDVVTEEQQYKEERKL